jgi:hypothetical protein
VRFFHNKDDIVSKRCLNIGRMTIPMLRAEHRFQIFVKLVNNATIAVHVRSSDDVRDVRVWFRNLLDPVHRRFHHENCYLTFQSKILHDGYQLSDYNIQKDCTIRQQVRLRGGGLELADVNMEEIIMTEY